MNIETASDPVAWDAFLQSRQFRPFLQSWTMGEVYGDIGQPPVRLAAMENGRIIAICFAHAVPARRGKHLSVPYGPVIDSSLPEAKNKEIIAALLGELKTQAKANGCAFIRLSPFWKTTGASAIPGSISSPLHLLAEQLWYLPLRSPDPWQSTADGTPRSETDILAAMRKTTRNLIRRAEKDGVTVSASTDAIADLPHFIRLHDETRKRHGFTPYTNKFFESQVRRFAAKDQLALYLAHFQGETIAASIHMRAFGETSYHHGAMSTAHAKVPASYLLQWTAIQDALKRGDHIYNFWGIAPLSAEGAPAKNHPFGGVTLFKTGFGGGTLALMHCRDIPVTPTYWLTYAFERMRKWRRGF